MFTKGKEGYLNFSEIVGQEKETTKFHRMETEATMTCLRGSLEWSALSGLDFLRTTGQLSAEI